MANNAYMPNVQPLIEAGLGRKTATAIAHEQKGVKTSPLKEGVRKLLRIKDEQEFVNKGTWYNTYLNMSSQEVERLFYYKGSLMFFRLEKKYYLMPYTLDSELDIDGRYKYVRPIPIVSSATDDKSYKALAAYLANKRYKVIREVVLEEDYYKEDGTFDMDAAKSLLEDSCVIINDYTPQMAQKIIPRAELQDCVIDVESDCIPFMRTALLNSTGVQGMKVNTEDEQSSVQIASDSIDCAALNGKKYIPVVGGLDFQNLTQGTVGHADEFLLSMQSLDNFRHSCLGIDNAGLFQKSQYVTDGQNQVNAGNVGLIAQDSITQRQTACNIINSIWGLGIWYEPSEILSGMDYNNNGYLDTDNTPIVQNNDTEANSNDE